MAYTTATLYPSGGAGEGAPNDRLLNSEPASGATASCNFGTDTTDRYILVEPGIFNNTAPNQTASPLGIAAQNAGYNILKTDMNVTGAKRRIISGSVQWLGTISMDVADTLNQVYRIVINYYKRSADGSTYTLLLGTQSGLFTPTTGRINFDFTTASFPETIFESDETLHVEVWIRGRGAVVTGRVISFLVGKNVLDPEATRTILPAAIATRYFQSASSSASFATAIQRKTNVFRTTTITLTTAFARAGTIARLFTAPLSLAVAIQRKTNIFRTTTLTPTTAITKKVIPNPLQTTLMLDTAIQRKTNVFKTATITLTTALSRAITAARAFTTNISLSTAFARRVLAARAFDTTLTLTTAFARAITAARAFTANLTLDVAIQRKIFVSYATSLVLDSAFARTITASRAFQTTITFTTSFFRRFIGVRAFTTNLVLTTKLYVCIAQDILNRIVGGGTTTIELVQRADVIALDMDGIVQFHTDELEIVHGSDKSFHLLFTDYLNNPLDITGSSIDMAFKLYPNAPNSHFTRATGGSGITILDQNDPDTLGRAQVDILAAHTSTLPNRQTILYYDVDITMPGSVTPATPFRAKKLIVNREITP